ncbi:MAG: sugar ABC transporter substrate-binding protein [Chloroflexota bacterium]
MTKLTIGFSNIYERNPFTVKVRENLEALAATLPDVDLIVRDNNMDTPTAVANSEEFASIPVDAAIVFHIDQRAGQQVIYPLRVKGIPAMCVDVPIATIPYFGLDNVLVGRHAGAVLAEWINANWGGRVDKTLVVVSYQLLDFFQARVTRALDMLAAHVEGFSHDRVLFIDHGDSPEENAERVSGILNTWQDVDHIAILTINDDFAVGTLRAVEQAGRANEVALLSHDGTEVAIAEFKKENSPLVVSTLLRPDVYAERMMALVLRLARGESIPQWNYVETTPMTRDNYRELVNNS